MDLLRMLTAQKMLQLDQDWTNHLHVGGKTQPNAQCCCIQNIASESRRGLSGCPGALSPSLMSGDHGMWETGHTILGRSFLLTWRWRHAYLYLYDWQNHGTRSVLFLCSPSGHCGTWILCLYLCLFGDGNAWNGGERCGFLCSWTFAILTWLGDRPRRAPGPCDLGRDQDPRCLLHFLSWCLCLIVCLLQKMRPANHLGAADLGLHANCHQLSHTRPLVGTSRLWNAKIVPQILLWEKQTGRSCWVDAALPWYCQGPALTRAPFCGGMSSAGWILALSLETIPDREPVAATAVDP